MSIARHALLELLQLHARDRRDVRLVERVEHHDLVDAVHELGPEMGLHLAHHRELHHLVVLAGHLLDHLRAEVRGHDDHRVLEVHGAPLAVGHAPVVEHLQQHVEHVRVRLLDLVEQDHAVGLAPHDLREVPALLVADVSRRARRSGAPPSASPCTRTCRCARGRPRNRTGTPRAPCKARSCPRPWARGTGTSRRAGSGPRGPRASGGWRRTRGARPRPGPPRAGAGWSSMRSSFSRSPCIILETGMPVARDTTSAISSTPTCVRSSRASPSRCAAVSASFSCFSSCGILPYCSSLILLPVALALGLVHLELGALELFLDVGRALHARLLGLPDFLEVGVFLLEALDLVLDEAQALLGSLVLLLLQRLALDLELDEAPVEAVHHLGLGIDLHLDARGRLVDQVDRLVGKEAVRDVARARAPPRRRSPGR